MHARRWSIMNLSNEGLMRERTSRAAAKQKRMSERRPAPRAGYVLLFAFLSVVYHSNLRPIASGDSLPASLIPFSILLDHSLTLDRFAPYLNEHVWYAPAVLHKTGAHWFSAYPIAGPVVTTCLYLPVACLPWFGRQSPATIIAVARIAEKVVAVALASAAAVALLLLLRRLTSARAAWMLTLLFALGTGNWSTSSQALWQHSYGQLAIIGCLYSIDRWSASDPGSKWYWMAGLFAGIGVAVRPTNLVLIPTLALVLRVHGASVARCVRVFAPPAIAAFLVAAYNLLIFHSVAGGYPAKLDGRFFDGLLGVLLSPGRGLLVYTPVAIFALAAFAPRARELRERHWLAVIAAGVFSVLHIGLISMWPVWWGGYCWGPRLLTEILAPVMTLVAIGLPALRSRRWKGVFAGAAVYCCLIQALGVYYYPKGRWDSSPVSVDLAPARLWSLADNPVLRTLRGGFVWEPYSIVAAGATGGWPAAAKKLQETGISPY
jgi:hypothetical protein